MVTVEVHRVETEDRVELGVLEWSPPRVLYGYPVLLVHGFSQNNLTWHGRSGGIAPELCKRGFHVFSLDLRGSGYSRLKKLYYDYTLEDLVFKDLRTAVSFIGNRTGKDKIVLVGHSLGGICSYVFSSFFGRDVWAIITLGSPVYLGDGVRIIRVVGTFVRNISRIPLSSLVYHIWPREFAMKVLGFVGLFGFPLMRSKRVLRTVPLYPAYSGNFDSLWDFWEKFVKGFDFSSPRLFVQMLRWAAERRITSADGKIDYTEKFRSITVPLFSSAGTLDRIAPPESVRPIIELVSSSVKLYKEYEAGHLDLVEGRLARKVVVSDIESFLLNLIYS